MCCAASVSLRDMKQPRVVVISVLSACRLKCSWHRSVPSFSDIWYPSVVVFQSFSRPAPQNHKRRILLEMWGLANDSRRKAKDSVSVLDANRCVIDKSKSADFGSLGYSDTSIHTLFASQPESSCVGLAFLGWLTAWDFAQKFQENVLSSCVVRLYMPLFLVLIQQLYDALDIVK